MERDLLEKTLSFLRLRFQGDHSGHDYYHSLRVYRMAAFLCKKESADPEITELAALLHDVDDYKLFGGEAGACTEARAFLKENHISEEKAERICGIIADISFKGEDTKVPESPEGRIVQDADRLDAIGAIGIARAFAYGGSRNRDLYLPEEPPRHRMNFEEYSSNRGTTVNHFYEKLLLLKDRMNTKTAKSIAERRHAFLEDFLTEFFDEWNFGG